LRFGYTVSEPLVKSHPDYPNAEKEYQKKNDELVKKFSDFEAKVQASIDNYGSRKKAGALQPELDSLEKEIRKLNEYHKFLKSDFEEQLAKKQSELFDSLINEVNNSFEAVGKAKDLDVIFQAHNSKGVSFVLYSAENANIFNELLKEFGSNRLDNSALPFETTEKKTKIGYTNLEMVMLQMPEYDVVEGSVRNLKKKLFKEFKEKQDKGVEMLEKYNSSQNQFEKASLYEKIKKIDSALVELENSFEQKLIDKREDLMTTVLNKLDNAIKVVAEKGKFTLILNQTISSGLSSIVSGPKNADLTYPLLKQLEIENEYIEKEKGKIIVDPKVGFVNIELILGAMDEVTEITKKVEDYKLKLYQEIKSVGKVEAKKLEDTFLYKVDNYQIELLKPVLESIQLKIDDLAKEKGYDYIINQTGSNVLYIKESLNLTNELQKKIIK